MNRRQFLSLIAAAAAGCPAAHAGLGLPSKSRRGGRPYDILEVYLSYGQSWRSNAWPSFDAFGLNPLAGLLLALHVPSQGGPNFKPGPLPNGAGINLPSTPDGVTSYRQKLSTADDAEVTIGRCAVMAQQLLRARGGIGRLNPILETCAAFPGSTWRTGGGGGLCPGASFNGAITNNILAASGDVTGFIAANQKLHGDGIPSNYNVLTDNGDGTYDVGVAQITIAEAMTAGSASFIGQMGGGGGPSATLTVQAPVTNTIQIGAPLTGPGVLANTTIIEQLTGATGKDGSYLTQVGSPISVSLEPMTTTTTSWTNLQAIVAAINVLVTKGIIRGVRYRSVGYTQGTSLDNTSITDKEFDITDMLVKFDALGLTDTDTEPLLFYIGQNAYTTSSANLPIGSLGTAAFCRTNAPGAGGPYSGRAFLTTPWYQWAIDGIDNIHTDGYGTARHGEIEGYAKYVTEDLQIPWTPLWRDLAAPISVSGQIITIPYARPSAPDFANSAIQFSSGDWGAVADPGMRDDKGFHVIRGASALTVASVAVDGADPTKVHVTVQETLNPGDQLGISNGVYGTAGTNPGLYVGARSNLVMPGPDSILFPGSKINAWAVPFDETVQ